MQQSKLLALLGSGYSDISIEPAESYYWSPNNQTVYFQEGDDTEVGLWTLLHEMSHGILGHTTYQSDFELVKLEVEAWEHAKKLAIQINEKRSEGDQMTSTQKVHSKAILIDEDHIQDCLDTYRDWQYKRSLCPHCDLGGVQTDQKTYTCLFCDSTWQVSSARFCRPYRQKSVEKK